MYENLILSGGSLKGFAYLGVLQYLEEHNMVKNIRILVGTSIGAFICLLIILNYNYKTIVNFFMKFNPHSVLQYKVKNLFENYGMDNGIGAETLIKKFLKHKGYDPDITLQTLHSITGKTLAVAATKINTRETVFMCHETYPDLPVYLAVRMSMNVPIIFSPVKYKGDIYVDGCLGHNLPVRYFKEKPKGQILAISLKGNLNKRREISSLQEFIYGTLKCSLNTLENSDLQYCKQVLLTEVIEIDLYYEDNLQFNISDQVKRNFIKAGYDAISK